MHARATHTPFDARGTNAGTGRGDVSRRCADASSSMPVTGEGLGAMRRPVFTIMQRDMLWTWAAPGRDFHRRGAIAWRLTSGAGVRQAR